MRTVICAVCETEFTPKQGGHNAKYCKRSCKSSVKYYRERLRMPKEEKQQKRRKAYASVKADPRRYENHKSSNRKSVKKVREWLAEYKVAMGCVDCGYNKHYSALQLDHEGIKSVPISHARSSIARLQKEIVEGQCKVRCANCHSIRTWERKQKK